MSNFTCRICGSTKYSEILDYGKQALAGALLASLDEVPSEQKYQLTLVFCEGCSHVQILEILDPSLLFSNYLWETGVGSSIKRYCEEFAVHVAERTHLPANGLVVEIASNDGTLLREFQSTGRRVQGVDPAVRIANGATARGVPTRAEFFNLESARRVVADLGPADLMVARNVLAHVADLHGLVEGVRTVLGPSGTAVIEFPYLAPLYEELQYDQVYHEHIGFHSLDSVRILGELHGMRVIDVESVPLHGGSIRCYLAHESDPRAQGQAVVDMLAAEAPLLTFSAWQEFGDRVREQKRLLREELTSARARGEIVVGYGASGKGQALIQLCELDTSHVNYIVDKAEVKHGMFTPGSHIPIFDPSHMHEAGADILLLFSWNLAAEIVTQEKELAERGLRFLHPIPVPHYL